MSSRSVRYGSSHPDSSFLTSLVLNQAMRVKIMQVFRLFSRKINQILVKSSTRVMVGRFSARQSVRIRIDVSATSEQAHAILALDCKSHSRSMATLRYPEAGFKFDNHQRYNSLEEGDTNAGTLH